MSIYNAIGLTFLPHLGGFAGALITKKQVSGNNAWFQVIEILILHNNNKFWTFKLLYKKKHFCIFLR